MPAINRTPFFYNIINQKFFKGEEQIEPVIKKLFEKLEDGDTYLDLVDFYKESFNKESKHGISDECFTQHKLNELIESLINNDCVLYIEKKSDILKKDFKILPFILMDKKLFIAKTWYMEKNIVKFFDIQAQKREELIENLSIEEIDDFQKKATSHFDNIELNEEQKKTIEKINKEFLFFLLGGPGTGKTTIVSSIIQLIKAKYKKNIEIALCAPTGKATSHLEGVVKKIGHNCEPKNMSLTFKTIHKLLNIDVLTKEPKNNQKNTLNFDLIIVDETSMIDINLMYALISAVKPSTRLIFLGDQNQLPPIHFSGVLDFVVETYRKKNDNVVVLKESNRFKEGQIKDLANLILNHHKKSQDNENEIKKLFDQNNLITKKGYTLKDEQSIDFDKFIYEHYHQGFENYWSEIKKIEQTHHNNIDLNHLFNLLFSQVVLCVYNEDIKKFNDSYLKKLGYGSSHRHFSGKPIMITENDYSLDLSNGDIGIVFQIKEQFENENRHKQKNFRVYFRHLTSPVNLNLLKHYQTAFAYTIHKSQGSEFETVYLMMCQYAHEKEDEKKILNKKLLYTAVTRAKVNFHFMGSQEKFFKALNREDQKKNALSLFFNQSKEAQN